MSLWTWLATHDGLVVAVQFTVWLAFAITATSRPTHAFAIVLAAALQD